MINPDALTFIRNTNEDPLLCAQIVDMDVEGLMALAQRQGYHFSKSEFLATLKGLASGELSERDLDQVAGGYQTGGHGKNPSSLGAFGNNASIAVLVGL